jgi:hypothetical protein
MAAAAKLSPRDTKRARELAERLENISHEMDPMERSFFVTEGRHLGLALAPRKRVARDVGPDRKAQRKDERRKVERANRDAVMSRSGGACERETGEPGQPLGPCGMRATDRDHFWGRGREESVDGSWALCRCCHRAKTENKPSRAYWLWSFARHAMRHGYDGQVLRTMRAIQFEEAQHPEHALSEARAPRGGRQEGRTG